MSSIRQLMIETMDRKLLLFAEAGRMEIPSKGWINGIRTTLNMTLEQFGKRLGMTRQGARRIEISEASGTISINLLKEAGKVLNMKFVYGFIPEDNSLESMIEERAHKLAEMIVTRSSIHMKLEGQGVSEESIKRSIDDMIYDYKREVPKILWDLSN